MSLKSFNAFMAKVNAEETLRNELKQANPDGMTIDALAAVAAQHGFHFDAQDVSNELSEKELDLVAGGMDIIGPLQIKGRPEPIISRPEPIISRITLEPGNTQISR
ncbi:MAG: Nif11-like leader peptide family RiPP precursor [Propionivibrio sp.]|uniref:Nif11-like leader peptide family RiPP n=1 Tax=Candidatus Propionivibrio dominans TaxID=2954373 RepID=A0A9D7F7E5_9RHOO|nr:Nif11-like leader peptide family RiPP precursor [Candidatus Propionivibrio dominans]MBL0167523.1 Nif11-like leader peptide family RiPP precursor [Propionivibrio sp.]